MNRYFIGLVFSLCSFLSINLWADSSPEQHEKIQTIQKAVQHDLIQGNIEHARNQLDEASGNFHSEEIELAIIQTLMQGGEYRHALSAAAHTQAEHQDFSDATLCYAWLLTIGGQTQSAKDLLISSLAKHKDSNLTTALVQINSNQLNADAFTSDNIQLAPITDKQALINYKFLTNGIALDATHVVTSRISLKKNKHFLMRNGVGLIYKAHIDETWSYSDLVQLIIENPAPLLDPPKMPNKTPFPGTPIYSMGFAQDAKPQWPELQIDILGSPLAGTNNIYSLNNQRIAYGAGIYNLSGQLIGMVMNDGSATRKMRALTSSTIKTDGVNSTSPRLASDQVYENALPTSMQIFADY